MRRKVVLGVGLAALVASSAVGQFASDRPPQGSTLPSPAGPAKAAPLPGGLQPVSSPAPTAQPGSPAPTPVRPASPASPSTTETDYKPLYSSAPPAGAYVPPVDGLRPPAPGPVQQPAGPIRPAPSFTAVSLDAEIPTALPKDHEWRLTPEHGPWFILVKSYVRPSKDSSAIKYGTDKGLTALELAEGLAHEIRDTFLVQAFLYEYISEERKAELRAIATARQKAANDYVNQLDAIKHKAQLQGMDFLAPDNKFRVRRHESRDQIGVLVGPFQTEADAHKALVKLKKWPAPKNELLMDGGAIVKPGADGNPVSVMTRVNPYATAFVVPNPAIVKTDDPARRREFDPFVIKLNEGNPYSLLKVKKDWTLAVKAFTSSVEIVSKNSDTSLMKKVGLKKGGDALAAGGEQAEEMARAIRAMKGPGGQSLGLEAYVLHTRNASLVTVGQYDSPNDPALLAAQRLLGSMKLNVSQDQTGLRPVANAPALFDNIMPIPVPKP